MTKKQRQAIRDIAHTLFDGGNPATDEEIKDDWKEYRFFFDTALFALDARYGNWLFSPMGNDIAQMGVKSFEAYELIRSLFREKIDREIRHTAIG